MTSQPSLPYVTNGMIWDGVTEYVDDKPPGVVRLILLRMYGDGTRRFSEFVVTGSPMTLFRSRTLEEGWETIGVTFEGFHPMYLDGRAHLGYDGSIVLEPVNQTGYLNPFRAHAARFAHELDDAMGHHSLASAEESDRLAVRAIIRDLIGSAAIKYDEWDAIDPEELIVGGNYDGTPLWKRDLEDYQTRDLKLCSQCSIATFARQVLKRGNIPLYKQLALVRDGFVYSIDRSVTPWGAEIFDVATQPQSEYYIALDAAYEAMLDYYDMVVAPAAHAVAPDV